MSQEPLLTLPVFYTVWLLNQLQCYWKQNSSHQDYKKYTTLLYCRLTNCGYNHKALGPAFLETAGIIDSLHNKSHIPTPISEPSPMTTKLPSPTALFCITYHHNRLQNCAIQKAFRKHCKFGTGTDVVGICNPYTSKSSYAQHLEINRLLIARSMPKNMPVSSFPSSRIGGLHFPSFMRMS